ncbi:PQQ-dependent sugar dehydrogenase [Paractinoplanes brasiliensis]|uniref:Glucose/arabinose dehydrogenase n=1 Tax=Paractinoplanes brasiliensis TaxID=52695 RepID=A0A4V6PSY3_9ACTN|nr:PQQ-dependent sugar dehydrogenase [Actinoplanes brasiliensis]TDO41428.1 glucose/arabinose dehydrogenase [Actinoplanes brasiliensis]GID27288.1 oxidoreductase [Actinoplanes brasiliensis]
MNSAARIRLVLASALAFVLVACSDGEASAPSGATFPPEPSARPATPSQAGPKTPRLGKGQIIVAGLEVPWGVAFLPDGSALVSERDRGDIRQVPAGGGSPKRVHTVEGVDAGGEGGLLGLAVDPDYERNKFVYAYFTAGGDNRIIRFTLAGGKPQVIFKGIDKARIHNGGRLAFGPDNFLYVGTGDAGNGSASQDRDNVNGKILRITRDGKPAPGNPFPGSPVWSLGHRNVQGLAWGPDKKMYGIEFGQNTWDEVNVIQPGKNYGWPEVEGKEGRAGYVDPIVQWSTDEASPSGAAVAGNTLYVAGLRGERLWTVPLDGGKPKAELVGELGRLRTVAVAPDGALWVTTSNRDGRGDPRNDDDKILRFRAG